MEISGDNFLDWLAGVKHINDAHGHLVGDAVLREISNRLQASVRTYDFIGRYAGEEFLIMIPSCDPPDFATAGTHWNPGGKRHGLIDNKLGAVE